MPTLEIGIWMMSPRPTALAGACDDSELMRRYIQSGDCDAMDSLFRFHADGAFRLALRWCGNPADAEDVVQTAFLQVLKQAAQYRGQSCVRGWIMSIVINTCRMKIRDCIHRRAREATAIQEQTTAAVPDKAREELASAAVGAVSGLDERYRLPIWLHYLEGMSFKEVADALLLKEGTVREQARRGIEQVRQSLTAAGFSVSMVAIPELLASSTFPNAPPGLTASF